MSNESIVSGYIVSDHEGNFLTRSFIWYGHEDIGEAAVHSVETIFAIALIAQREKWDKVPEYVTPAAYNLDTDTTKILGEKKTFNEEVDKLKKVLAVSFTGMYSA